MEVRRHPRFGLIAGHGEAANLELCHALSHRQCEVRDRRPAAGAAPVPVEPGPVARRRSDRRLRFAQAGIEATTPS